MLIAGSNYFSAFISFKTKLFNNNLVNMPTMQFATSSEQRAQKSLQLDKKVLYFTQKTSFIWIGSKVVVSGEIFTE